LGEGFNDGRKGKFWNLGSLETREIKYLSKDSKLSSAFKRKSLI
jgi:hypothetical protein